MGRYDQIELCPHIEMSFTAARKVLEEHQRYGPNLARDCEIPGCKEDISWHVHESRYNLHTLVLHIRILLFEVRAYTNTKEAVRQYFTPDRIQAISRNMDLPFCKHNPNKSIIPHLRMIHIMTRSFDECYQPESDLKTPPDHSFVSCTLCKASGTSTSFRLVAEERDGGPTGSKTLTLGLEAYCDLGSLDSANTSGWSCHALYGAKFSRRWDHWLDFIARERTVWEHEPGKTGKILDQYLLPLLKGLWKRNITSKGKDKSQEEGGGGGGGGGDNVKKRQSREKGDGVTTVMSVK